MVDQTLRVRFAPSPTGFLHVGGARTALFNWLLARRHKGGFILRIEDTDRSRSSDEMTAAILDSMKWLGLEWDEGPFHQADGFSRHRSDALTLLAANKAYPCFCTPEQVQARRGPQQFGYDRYCLYNVTPEQAKERAAAGEPFAVRLRVPEGKTAWDDAVHGYTEFDNSSIEDFVILRSDGTPLYNMAVVSDDVAMKITHVIRGDDHISNTPKQILIYQALSHEPPVFAHVPMILGPDGKRLSKRHGATAVGEYRERGILPQAMVNFLALLGWSPGEDRELMSVDEMIERFSLEGINKKSAVFDTTKLEWMNGQYLAQMSSAELAPLVIEKLAAEGLANNAYVQNPAWLHRLLDLLKVRARTINGIVAQARPFIVEHLQYEPEAVQKHWKDRSETSTRLRAVREQLADVPEWQEPVLEEKIRQLAENFGVGAGKVIHPLRIAITGTGASPGIFDVLTLLGRERSLRRIDAALDTLADGK